ncbi:hypothetical protein [Dolosigranulum savutiense]|uniref:Uncharacterized protein n=1 Tax=Dolosigranulum savutiense TaxID=3110288 RepID=A0AB74TNK0_9LACT
MAKNIDYLGKEFDETMEGDVLTPICSPLADNYSYIGEFLPERQYIYFEGIDYYYYWMEKERQVYLYEMIVMSTEAVIKEINKIWNE